MSEILAAMKVSPSPLVGEGARAKRGRVRGLSPRRQTPHPARRRIRAGDPPSPARGEGGPIVVDAVSASTLNDLAARVLGEIEAVEIADLAPYRGEVLHELLLGIVSGIDLGQRAELRVRAE